MPMVENALVLGIVMLTGLLCGRIFQHFKVPMIVGFILIGILLGPFFLNVITFKISEELELVKMLVLGVIAYTIGVELNFKEKKQILSAILIITIIQVITTFILVFLTSYYLLALSLPVALLLGTIATATNPASPLACCREYGAKGTFTSTLLGTVAFIDAVCIVLFAIVSAFVMLILKENLLSVGLLALPFVEIGGSLTLGFLAGIVIILAMRYIHQRPLALTLLLGTILLNIGIANILHLSPLLANLATGITVTNFNVSRIAVDIFEDIETPLYLAFFTLVGASLPLNVLSQSWIGAAFFIIARGIGKVGGTYLGAVLAKAESRVQKYLGFGMFSKAGLSIGMVLMVQKTFPAIADSVTAIVLGAVAVCTIIGPFGERFALVSSGEVQVDIIEEPSPIRES